MKQVGRMDSTDVLVLVVGWVAVVSKYRRKREENEGMNGE